MGFLGKLMRRIKEWLTHRCPNCRCADQIHIVDMDTYGKSVLFVCLKCGYEWYEWLE